jgi:hypothetical protein
MATVLSVVFSLSYLILAEVITSVASSRGMCGDGDLRPPCAMFFVAIAIYGIAGIGTVSTLGTLVAVALRRRVPQLLKASSVLNVTAVLVLVLPVLAAGNNLAGAIVVMLTLPLTILLLAAAWVCFVIWLGRSMIRGRRDEAKSAVEAPANLS